MNKLVRDKIVDFLEADGCEVTWRNVTGAECRQALIAKLSEEFEEFKSADGADAAIEELADVYEVVLALGDHLGGMKHVETMAWFKRERKGGFADGVFVDEVHYPE